MSKIEKDCLNCGEKFLAPKKEIKRGNGKFCSRSCCSQHRVAQREKPQPNVSCANCGKEFYKNASKKRNSKSGLFFCERKCKDEAQRMGGIKEIMPDHYGKGTRTYVSICKAHHDMICVVCGEDKIVAVHHYDRNHHNDDPKNLVPLCPTHHYYVHSRYEYLVADVIDDYVKTKWSE